MNISNIKIISIIIISSLLCLIPIIFLPINLYDEGVILSGAERIIRGEVIYKDFWSLYSPGQFYTVATLFNYFGESVFVERIYDAIVKLFLSIISFIIVKRSSSLEASLVAWGMVLILLKYSGFPGYPIYPSIFFILVSVYLLQFFLEDKRIFWIIATAIAVIIAGLFRHDFGVYAFLAHLFVLLLVKNHDESMTWLHLLIYILTLIIFGSVFIIYFINLSGFEVIKDVVLGPLDNYSGYRWLPYPTILNIRTIPFYLVPIILVYALVLSLLSIRKEIINKKVLSIFTLSCIGIVLLNHARTRSDLIHLVPATIVCALLVPLLFENIEKNKLRNYKKIGVYPALFALILYYTVNSANFIKDRMDDCNSSLFNKNKEDNRISCVKISNDIRNVIKYIRQNTKKDDVLFVGVTNHDKFVINDVIIYFLSNRNYATKFHHFEPGITNSILNQNYIVNELKSRPAQLIVLASRERREPNLSLVDKKIDIIDSFIHSNYKFATKYGIYEIWLRK